jgi:hypothetical protein
VVLTQPLESPRRQLVQISAVGIGQRYPEVHCRSAILDSKTMWRRNAYFPFAQGHGVALDYITASKKRPP